MAKEIITPEVREQLEENFKNLQDDVVVHVYTKKGLNDQYNEVATQLVREFAGVDKRIKAEYYELGAGMSAQHGVDKSPTILIGPNKYSIKFSGSPLGEEGRTFVMSLIMASTGNPYLNEKSFARLMELKEKRHVEVFVSPT